MRSCNRVIGCALLLLVFLSCNVSRGPKSGEDSKQQLLALENRWLQVEDDPVVLESILAPDFLHVVPGEIITKEQQLQFLRQHPASSQHPEKHFEDLHVRVYGEAGIVNGAVIKRPRTASVRLYSRMSSRDATVNGRPLAHRSFL